MSTDYKSCTNLATGKTSFDLIGPKYARSRHRKRFRPNFLVTWGSIQVSGNRVRQISGDVVNQFIIFLVYDSHRVVHCNLKIRLQNQMNCLTNLAASWH